MSNFKRQERQKNTIEKIKRELRWHIREEKSQDFRCVSKENKKKEVKRERRRKEKFYDALFILLTFTKICVIIKAQKTRKEIAEMADKIEYRILTEAEEKYTHKSSAQISGQTGLIGHLWANMAWDEDSFLSTWEDYRRDLKTEEFHKQFNKIIHYFREAGNILHCRKNILDFINENGVNGFRIDTEKYAFLFRVDADGEKNCVCYCYIKDWLDGHLRNAERGIRFIDSKYTELFRIKDGERIVVYSDRIGKQEYVCRYIDDYHVEVGLNLYHICEFAELMERGNCIYKPAES